MQFEGCFSIDSYNNFPLSAGLASSASSFAALSSCAIQSIEAIVIQLVKIVESFRASPT